MFYWKTTQPYLLLPLQEIDSLELEIGEATFGKRQANSVNVCRARETVQSESRHFGGVE